jgi:plasmid maintenance system antidote protein VapI
MLSEKVRKLEILYRGIILDLGNYYRKSNTGEKGRVLSLLERLAASQEEDNIGIMIRPYYLCRFEGAALRDRVKAVYKTTKNFCSEHNLHQATLSRFYNGKRALSDDMARKFRTSLQTKGETPKHMNTDFLEVYEQQNEQEVAWWQLFRSYALRFKISFDEKGIKRKEKLLNGLEEFTREDYSTNANAN